MLTFPQVWSFSPPPDDADDAVAIESASSTPGISSAADSELIMNSRPRTLFSDPPPTIPSVSDSDQLMPDAPS
jgi:F-box and WD-40 domain protein CDC4